jgi:hypothetical protein
MAQRGGKSRRTRLLLLAAACAALSGLLVPATGAARNPAVDQYTANLPTAGGPKSPGGNPPQANPDSLPQGTDSALKGQNGDLLAQVATSRELGAPNGGNGSSSDESNSSGKDSGGGSVHDALAGTGRGVPAVATETADSGPGLWLIAALAAITGLAAFLFIRRRRASSGPSE